ncbi:AAA family ATPase [Clostridium sp. B9]|uniref:AAA family ATPase n=1 Tax=Clostridium sp. B9 TaxID=3423224 RepID=UPI003D2F259E
MKVEKIKFNNHEVFNDLNIDFRDNNGEILNTIVLIGENGSGKTTLLKSIYDSFGVQDDECAVINKKMILSPKSYTATVMLNEGEVGDLDIPGSFEIGKFIIDSKVIYMPTEINFERVNKVDNTFNFEPTFQNIIDQNMTQNIPSLIATKINKEIFKNRNKTIGEVIDMVCEEINSVFSIMDLDVKLVGLSETNETKPIFRNSLGKEFDIRGLSSGEKQLFLRALALKFLNPNNSIILIDEPEISLHPQWQKKIIDVYESIGENNQLIIATHSPHIIGDIESKQLRVIKRDNNGINIDSNEELIRMIMNI